jgi:putative copper export protein
MVINTTITLTYAIVALVVAIISATIMRAKLSNWDRFGIGDAFLAMSFGVAWPITIVVGIVYLASDFLYGKFCK